MKNIVLGLPAFNEEENIEELIGQARAATSALRDDIKQFSV